MSAPAGIVDKLRSYEYEQDGYADAVGDIYALIRRIALLEEEIEYPEIRARESDAWRSSYYALLGECEASRSPSQAVTS